MIAEKTLNRTLHIAKSSKKDEFYTQLSDIESELSNTQISYSNIDVLTSVESKTSSGGTSKKQIQNTIDWILNRLNKI